MNPVLEQMQVALHDRYRVEVEIGRGGMATVYRAQDLKYDRRVAIKVLSPEAASAISSERFAREIRIAARLSHPNIVAVFDSGEAAGLLYYVMPLVEGESLRSRMARDTYLPIDEAIQVACEVAAALSYAHGHGVVHRDIKPENILLHNGNACVADFGIARAADRIEGDRLTASGMSIGTAAYMSPEQSAGETVDERADVYSLGCTLYEMLAGHPPFSGGNAMAIMARRMMEPPPSIRVVRPAVPEELEAAVMRAMERVPVDRFQTMEQFKAAVLGEASSTSAASRYSPRYHTASSIHAPPKRRKFLVGAGIGALVIVVGAFSVVRYLGKNAPPPSVDSNRVAVLYFNVEGTGDLRYLADGLTESLIDRLSSVRVLDVVSRDGVRVFRGKDVSTDSVGRALGVGSVVRGSVNSEGGKLRVTVRLVDAGSDADIARKSFAIDTMQLASAHGALATQVVDFLRQRLGDEVRLRTNRSETNSNQAWVLVERANKLTKDADSLSAAGTSEAAVISLARADSLLSGAERLDNRWARVPVLRAAGIYSRATQRSFNPRMLPAVIDSGVMLADRALKLQPNDPDAFEVKGKLKFLRYTKRVDTDPKTIDRLLPAAESDLTRAVELNRDQAGAWAALSFLYYAKPDIQAANIAALNAYRADAYLSSARLVLARLFWTSHDLEQFPEALKWCNEGRRRFPTDPHFTSCRLWMYTTRLERPDIDSVWTYRDRYLELTPAEQRSYAKRLGDILVAGALARAGLADSARHVLTRARATPAEDPTRELEGTEAVVRVILGDYDEAIRLIEDYLTVNPAHRKGFATRVGPWWRDLQSNPRFKRLIAGAR